MRARRRQAVAGLCALACGLGGGVLIGAPAADAGRAEFVAKQRAATPGSWTRAWKRGTAVPARGGLGRPAAAKPGTVPVTVPAKPTTTGPPTGTTTPAPSRPTMTPTSPPATTTPAPTPVLRTGAELKEFDVHLTRTTLDAGAIEVTATNYGMDEHDLALSRGGVVLAKTALIQPRDAATISFDVSPGTYKLFCTLYDGAHDRAGMHAMLTVK